ncbi:MAG: cation:proton antiporter [Wenzhouxiangellaceae bacterium]|nr:cation:proton antiporter [Wenzhouxiangellaceae bacterium]
MHSDSIIQAITLIFAGAAAIATFALYARQALPVAYIVLGVIVGPWGLGLVPDIEAVEGMAEIGIVFLLFLLGLNLEPRELLRMLREAVFIVVVTSLAFWLTGFAVALLFGLEPLQAVLIGAAVIFSSTIIGLKLLPTSTLHHQRMGEIVIAVLLLQDIVAITLILVIQGFAGTTDPLTQIAMLLVAAPALAAFAFLFARYVLMRLMRRFDRIQEYIFLLAIGWCLALAVAGHHVGLSYEIGAFLGGISIATNPISRFIAEMLKPLRDFFLIVFFFALGAGFDLSILPDIAVPSMVLAAALLFVKPAVFAWTLKRSGEKPGVSREIGLRLGQVSEFSLLVAVVGLGSGLMTAQASYIVQATTILTFIFSTYLIVLRVPTPVAVTEELRRD